MKYAWGRRGMHIRYWWESQKVRDHWEDQDVGEWTIIKWILEGQDPSGSEQRPVEGSCEHCNEPSGSMKCWEVLEQLTAGSFSRRAQIHE
jgi:hypothetical protein